MVHKHVSGETVSYRISSKRRRVRRQELPGRYADQAAARYALQFCDHTLAMLESTVNLGQKRLITRIDLKSYERLCHSCSEAKV